MKALAFLAGDGDTLSRFLALSGLSSEDLRTRAADPLVLAGILDFLLGDEGLMLAFATDEGVDPKMIQAARRVLPGAAPEM